MPATSTEAAHAARQWRNIALGVLLVGALLAWHAWALSRPWLSSPEPLFAWRKGPMITESNPYSSWNAARYAWPALAGMLDLYGASILAWFLVARRWPSLRRASPVVAVASLVLAFACGELSVRHAIHRWHYTQYRPDPELFWYNRPHLRDHSDPTDHEPKSTNSMGFRGTEEVPPVKEPGEVRIFVVGDSSTFGLGVPDTSTWSHILARELARETEREVRVVNTASPGHTSYQGWILWQRHVDLVQPDVLIWAYNNDSCLDMVTEADRLAQRPWVLEIEKVLYRSDLYLVLRQVVLDLFRSADVEGFRATYPSEVDGWVRRIPFDDYKGYLTRFEQSAAEHGARTVYVRMPLNRKAVERKPIFATSFDDGYRDYLTDEFCEEEGRVCADFEARFNKIGRPTLFLPEHLFHPSKDGHHIIGHRLARIILKGELLPDP